MLVKFSPGTPAERISSTSDLQAYAAGARIQPPRTALKGRWEKNIREGVTKFIQSNLDNSPVIRI